MAPPQTESKTTPVTFLLDVDGVLNPFGWGFDPAAAMPGYTAHEIDGYIVRLNPNLGAALVALADQFSAQIVWATTWNDKADTLIAPHAGLPHGLAVLEMPEFWLRGEDITWKLATVADWAENHPDHRLVWFEDDLQSDARRWAEQRPNTFLVQPSPDEGITQVHLDQVQTFLLAGESTHV